jgi:hypothetical protein
MAAPRRSLGHCSCGKAPDVAWVFWWLQVDEDGALGPDARVEQVAAGGVQQVQRRELAYRCQQLNQPELA